jgi:hypothetical protein
MASQVVYDAIRTFLDPAQGGCWQSTPIKWENEAAVSTADEGGNPVIWSSIDFVGNVYSQMSIGADPQSDNRWDEDGTLWFHFYVPVNTGSSSARGLAKSFADVFRGLTLLNGNLVFLDASIGAGAVSDDDGNWWVLSVSIGWQHIEA